MTTYREKFAKLPPERQKRIKARAKEILAEEMSLRALRQARQMTQANLAEQLDIKQENISRIEKRTDLLLSTLTKYVEGMGGKLHLVAEFPDSPPITLAGIQDLDDGLTEDERAGIVRAEGEISTKISVNISNDAKRAAADRMEAKDSTAMAA